MKKAVLLLAVALVLSVGSARKKPGIRMIPGKMWSLKDGNVLVFAAQYSYGSGIMTAFNPATGERFTGQYTGVRNITFSKTSGFWSSHTVATASNQAKIMGILRGDKGTIISIKCIVNTGRNPTGFGEGLDNKGVKYQLQF